MPGLGQVKEAEHWPLHLYVTFSRFANLAGREGLA